MRRLKVVDLDILTIRSIERQRKPRKTWRSIGRIPEDLQISPEEQIKFFKCIKFSFVISSLGDTNEAEKMSGGDYGIVILLLYAMQKCYLTLISYIHCGADGDYAWICWNEKLLACLPEQSVDPLPQTGKVVNPPICNICVWDATVDSLLEYSHHFRNHQRHIGQYADLLDVCIDLYGFEDPLSIELGWRSFFQVRI